MRPGPDLTSHNRRISKVFVRGKIPIHAGISLARSGYTGSIMERDARTRPRTDAGDRPDHLPRVSDALKGGVAVSIVTWSGNQLRGTVSDRDHAGLLLDVDEDAAGSAGYVFVPWSSIEQVMVPEIAPRRVKSLQS